MNYQDRLKECLERNKQAIFELMKRFNIDQATLEYRGFDSDGRVNRITYNSAKTMKVAKKVITPYLCLEYRTKGLRKVDLKVVTRQFSLHSALEHFALDLLELEQPHWAAYAGSEGTLTLDRHQRKCLLNHTAYFTESLTRQASY